MTCPVTVRGVSYPSQAAAAKALNVPPTAIYGAMQRGTLDRVGLGRWRHNTVAVTVYGRRFETIAQASKTLGVNAKTLGGRIAKARKANKNSFIDPVLGKVSF